jgi:hypothetical protein
MAMPAKGRKPFWGTITIADEPWQRNIVLADFGASRRRMMENLGVHVTDTRQLIVNGVSGFCVDGETAMMGTPVRNISCHLGTSLSMEYIGSPITAPSFYSILNSVSKASK